MNSEKMFNYYRNQAMQDVQDTARDIVGVENCYAKLARAAWAIAYSAPQIQKGLSTTEPGSEKSLVILQQAAANAVRLVVIFNRIRQLHNEGKQGWSPLFFDFSKPCDQSVKVTYDSANDGRKKCKKYLKYAVASLVGFLLGLFFSLVFRFVFELL